MGHLLLAAVLIAFVAPAIAETDSALLARPPPEGAAGGHASGARGAPASAIMLASDGARPRRLGLVGAVVTPAGGAHPVQPVIRVREAVQTIRNRNYRVLEIVYQ